MSLALFRFVGAAGRTMILSSTYGNFIWLIIFVLGDLSSLKDFTGIHSPKLVAGASEGSAAVFKLDYKGQPVCLAQSPQLYKQIAICGGFGRVFEVGPVFRAEDSYTHRHLCEFIGLDVEMEIKEHYFEVIDIVDRLFVTIFDHLNNNCKKLLDAINAQYPFEPLKYLRKTLLLTFEEGVQMLKEAGIDVDPLGDLNTETERKLGKLVLEKYDTEFYILHRYPLAVMPFYTMPCYDNPAYSNSFDVFIRGRLLEIKPLMNFLTKDRGYYYIEIATILMGLTVCFRDEIIIPKGNHESQQISEMWD